MFIGWIFVCGGVFSPHASAQGLKVDFDLNPPKLISATEVQISGTTNLPAGTQVVIRTDLTARPDRLSKVKGTAIDQNAPFAPGGTTSVTPQGTFSVTLEEPHRFKTGKYRVVAQVWVHGRGFFGSTLPQPKEFYDVAGKQGELLSGPAVDRRFELFSGHTAVIASGDFEFRPGAEDSIAKRESRSLRRFSKVLDQAYVTHQQLLKQGYYAQWAGQGNLKANRTIVDFGLRITNSHKEIRGVETQEAFFLLEEAINALDQVHYWSLSTVNPKPAEYAKAVKDYEQAKKNLDEFIDNMK